MADVAQGREHSLVAMGERRTQKTGTPVTGAAEGDLQVGEDATVATPGVAVATPFSGTKVPHLLKGVEVPPTRFTGVIDSKPKTKICICL